jgi:phosphonatase-like hydrolase
MKLVSIRLVVFDLGGTTIEDTGQVPTVLRSVLRTHGIIVTEADLHRWRGASEMEVIRGLVGARAEGRRLCADDVYGAFREMLLATIAEHGVRPLPGIEATFTRLRGAGVKVALTTGLDRVVADVIFEQLPSRLSLVDAVVCGDHVALGRPAPYMIFRAMEGVEILDVRHVASVGDTVNDLRAGWNAAVAGNIGVLTGAHSLRSLSRAPHTHILASATEVPDVLELGC